MPLSKARDRARKRLARLENKEVQPDIEAIMRANPILSKSVRKRLAVQVGIEFDADGNPIPDY